MGVQMKLWHLFREEGSWYDENHAFVIRAASEEEARELANRQGGDEHARDPDFWKSPANATCVEITADGPAEIILTDFLAG